MGNLLIILKISSQLMMIAITGPRNNQGKIKMYKCAQDVINFFAWLFFKNCEVISSRKIFFIFLGFLHKFYVKSRTKLTFFEDGFRYVILTVISSLISSPSHFESKQSRRDLSRQPHIILLATQNKYFFK